MQNHVKTAILCILLFLFGSILFYSNILIYPISCNNENYIMDIPKNSLATPINSCGLSSVTTWPALSTSMQVN